MAWSDFENKPKHDFDSRLKWLAVLAVLIIGVLIARLVYLQLYDGENYARLADGNRIRIIPSKAARGVIYDRNLTPVVSNRPGFTVSLLRLSEPISNDVIERLAVLLNIPKERIQEKIKNHEGFEPIHLKTDITPEVLAIIEEQKDLYPGVVIEVQPFRENLYNEVGAHVLGYVSEISATELEKKKDQGYKTGDLVGQFGLERRYDKELRGIDGGRQVEVDASGKPVQILGEREAQPGQDLVLTIDWKLQMALEQAMDRQLKLIGANAAAAVVLNPQTGEILALASRPTFNPNWFLHGISEKNWQKINQNPFYPLDNKVVTGEYPPGSTFKIVTGTAALQEKVVTPEEKILDTGKYWLDDKTNASGEVLGWINFEEALAHSDNYYFYEMGYRLGIDRLERYARMFGLGAKTGIDLAYEAEGLVASVKYKEKTFNEPWFTAETLDAAIGQGFNLVTPLQAALVMSQVATGGARYKPHLVQKILRDKEVVKEFKPELMATLAVDQENMKYVQEGLHEVTRYGTASGFFGAHFPIELAAKTGTAENPHGKDHGWFVAYGPFQNPTIALAVIVENGGFGSVSAMPIARQVFEFYFADEIREKYAPFLQAQQEAAAKAEADKDKEKDEKNKQGDAQQTPQDLKQEQQEKSNSSEQTQTNQNQSEQTEAANSKTDAQSKEGQEQPALPTQPTQEKLKEAEKKSP